MPLVHQIRAAHRASCSVIARLRAAKREIPPAARSPWRPGGGGRSVTVARRPDKSGNSGGGGDRQKKRSRGGGGGGRTREFARPRRQEEDRRRRRRPEAGALRRSRPAGRQIPVRPAAAAARRSRYGEIEAADRTRRAEHRQAPARVPDMRAVWIAAQIRPIGRRRSAEHAAAPDDLLAADRQHRGDALRKGAVGIKARNCS